MLYPRPNTGQIGQSVTDEKIAEDTYESIGTCLACRPRNRQSRYADDRNFYTLEKWTKDDTKVHRILRR
jgi:hypothetical protein